MYVSKFIILALNANIFVTKEYDTSGALFLAHRALYEVCEECGEVDLGRGRINVFLGAVLRVRDPFFAGVL